MSEEAKEVRLRAGEADDFTGFAGGEGELTYDETTRALRLMNGQRAGGYLQARAGDVVATDEDITLTLADLQRLVNVTADQQRQITLPATDSMPAGWQVMIRHKTGSAKVVIESADSVYINGAGELELKAPGQWATVIWAGDEWVAQHPNTTALIDRELVAEWATAEPGYKLGIEEGLLILEEV